MYEGVKKALRVAKKNDFILEMNNDLYFGPEYFAELVKFAKKHRNVLVGSMSIHNKPPHQVVEAGIRIDWPTGLVYGVAQTVSQKLSYYKNMEYIDNLDALPGKGTLIPVNVFKKIGNFNYKKLPHYVADYEFALRAKNEGFNLLVDTKAIAKHYWEATGIYTKNHRERVSYGRAFSLLFGKKSMNNIKDWVTFLFISCPREYLIRNLFFSFLKVVKAVFSVYPFFYLRGTVRYLLTKYLQLKNLTYIGYLKIKQFPEYHLKRKDNFK
jgi:GT2 family glycosyltransferase